MGKAAIAKKKTGPSVHSRAARRATSPSINTDKSLKELRSPVDRPSKASASPIAGASSDSRRPSVLAIHRSAGVFKKGSARKSALSSKQRKRRERGADIALAVAERTTRKVHDSWSRAKNVYERRKTWDAINGRIGAAMEGTAAVRGGKRGFAVLQDEVGAEAEDVEEAQEEDIEDEDGDADLIGQVDDRILRAAVTLEQMHLVQSSILDDEIIS